MSAQQPMYETAIEMPIGKDATQFYIGFKMKGKLNYNAVEIFKILNELKNASLNNISSVPSSKGIVMTNYIKGVQIELRCWTQGNENIDFQEVYEIFVESFIKIKEILIKENTTKQYLTLMERMNNIKECFGSKMFELYSTTIYGKSIREFCEIYLTPEKILESEEMIHMLFEAENAVDTIQKNYQQYKRV